MDDSAPVRLGEGYALALSPDGRWVLTCLIRSTPTQIVLQPTGAGEPKTFPKDEIEHASGRFGTFLPDGKRILFVGHEPGRPSRVFVQDLAGGAAKPVTPEGVVARLLSADGKSFVTGDAGGAGPHSLGRRFAARFARQAAASEDHRLVDRLAAREALDRQRADVQALAPSLHDHLGDRSPCRRRMHDAVA